jgi:microcystin-dependent protein|tara:strand:+ start:132 stop:824 length:693 start_codon:yes stop_codon:yes gene_type:complete
MASPIVRGQDFGSTETVNATKLQNIVDNSTFKGTDGNSVGFSASSGGDLGTCVAAGGLEVASTGQLQVKDDGITAAKIAAGALTDVVYPIGSIFITVNNYADSAAVVNAIGGTTWVSFGAGKVLVGVDSSDTDFDAAEETGGAKTKALEFANMPAHSHQWYNMGGSSSQSIDATSNTSSQSWNASGNLVDIGDPLLTNFYTNTATDRSANGSAFSIVQPYIVVYMWKRTA